MFFLLSLLQSTLVNVLTRILFYRLHILYIYSQCYLLFLFFFLILIFKRIIIASCTSLVSFFRSRIIITNAQMNKCLRYLIKEFYYMIENRCDIYFECTNFLTTRNFLYYSSQPCPRYFSNSLCVTSYKNST